MKSTALVNILLRLFRKMAGDDQAISDFTEILRKIDRKFDIIQAKWSDDKNFEIKFRTQIPRDNEDFNGLCDEWVDLFSGITNTVWVKKISNTGPKIRFRKQYQCWTRGGHVVQKELLFDATRCKGTLDVKVLTDNPQTRKKNKHIKMGLNVVVKINFTHLHSVDTTKRDSFFVHTCEPQLDVPKALPTQSTEKLSRLVAEMVQKGLDSTAKATSLSLQQNQALTIPETTTTMLHHDTRDVLQVHQDTLFENALQGGQIELQGLESIHINQLVPLHSMESIKLEVPHFQQVTQVLVRDDIGEQILLCQPTVMLDPMQVIPVTGGSLQSHHFVQLNSNNVHNQQGYL